MDKKTIKAIGLMVLFGICTLDAYAIDAGKVPEKKRTTLGLYLTAGEAYEFVQAHSNTLFVDVRTRSEVDFLGMATVADANVPYMEINTFWAWDDKKNNYKLEPNSQFVESIENRLKEKGLTTDANIVLMCRSGDRSAAAANLLAKAGYKHVYSIIDGYEGDMATDGPGKGRRSVNGWRNAGLPWSYELAKTKMTLEQ